MKNTFICVFVTAAFLSCSSSKNQFLLPEYSEKSPRISLLIVPLDDHFEIEPTDIEYKTMSEQDKRNFNNLFGLVFQDYTTAKILSIDDSYELTSSEFETENLSTSSKDSLSLMMPKQGVQMNFNGVSPDFTLFLQEYFIGFKDFRVSGSLDMQSSAGDKNYLFLRTKYGLWDNEKGTVAGWGNIEARVNFNGRITRQVYLNLIGKLSQQIIDYSPLKPRNI